MFTIAGTLQLNNRRVIGCLKSATIHYTLKGEKAILGHRQSGITCGAIDEPRKSSKVIDKRVIIDFRNKNVVIAH